jgi:repressor LexA
MKRDVVPLSAQNKRVFDAIRLHIRRVGVPPTVRELAAALGFKYLNAVNNHLHRLQKLGLIEFGGSSRSIRLVDPDACPVCGHAIAQKGVK